MIAPNAKATAAAKLALVKDAFEADERPQRRDMLNTIICFARQESLVMG